MGLAILDVMLPDANGFSICQHIREKHNFPVIMLTAKEEEIDKNHRAYIRRGRLYNQALPSIEDGCSCKGAAPEIYQV